MRLWTTETGNVYQQGLLDADPTQLDLPADVGVRAFPRRTSWVLAPGLDRLIIVGPFSAPLVWIPSLRRLWRAGIEEPTTAPTLAAGAGTGITGTAIGVYTFAEITAGEIVHESNPSDPSGAIALTNDNRAWSGLPTTHTNPRVTHKRLYVSMDGDDFLFVANVPLVDATYTEAVATADLDPLSVVNERRGVPPRDASIVTYYANRVWYGFKGSDRFMFSELNEPESVSSANELATKDARFVTCLRGLNDELIIGTRASIQYLQGFGASDFEVHYHTQAIGIVTHHGSIVVNDTLWAFTQEGYVRLSGGGYQFLMPTLRTYIREAYEAAPSVYEDLVAAVDRRRHGIKVLVPGESGVRVAKYFYGHFLPTETGGLPFWTFDTSLRYERVIGAMTEGNLLDRVYSAGCDGIVRKDDVEDEDDDGNSFNADFTLKHFFMGAQDGDGSHAKTFKGVTIFAKSESNAWTVSTYVGDDSATDALAPQWTKAVAASAQSRNGKTGVSRTQHTFEISNGAGHGCSVRVTVANPVGFEFRGVAIEFTQEGEQQRGRAS